jgi:hypothetical protein
MIAAPFGVTPTVGKNWSLPLSSELTWMGADQVTPLSVDRTK